MTLLNLIQLRFALWLAPPMPRFFFNIHDGTFMADDDGVKLTGIDDARNAVWNTLLPMTAEGRADGNMACQLRMDVRDEAGIQG